MAANVVLMGIRLYKELKNELFEKVGLPEVLGQRIWNKVKEYEAPREDLGQKNGKGMKM